MCVKLPLGDLNSDPYPSTPYKHLYLLSDYCTKSARWYDQLFIDFHLDPQLISFFHLLIITHHISSL